MSTTNVTPAVPENLAEGLKLFNAKLLPGKLADTTENASTLAAWVRSRGITLVSLPAAEIADTLYTAAKSLYYNDVLTWDAVPTKLKTELEVEYATKFESKQAKEHAKDQNENSESAFYARKKAAEEKEKKDRDKLAQEIAAQEIHSTIMGYSCNAGPNRVDHAKSDAHRNELLRQVDRRRKAGVDERKILVEVRAAIQELP